MLETVEQQTRPKPAWSVLWLHGLGADGHDFAPIVPELVRPDWPGIRFVFPHAPVRPVTINNGVPMRAWYDIRNLSIDQRADEEGLRASMAEVDALIARERDRGVPASRLLLVGFSQGGALALASGLRRESAVAGIACLSGYLPLADRTAAELTPARHAGVPRPWPAGPGGGAGPGHAHPRRAGGLEGAGDLARLPDAAFGVRRGDRRPRRLDDAALRRRLT